MTATQEELDQLTPEERRDWYRERGREEAEKLLQPVFDYVNRMGPGDHVGAIADVIANEHPTLAGQFAKAVGIGLMRRNVDPNWKPFDPANESGWTCFEPGSERFPDHRQHDGRIDCSTVIGAELLARQSFI